MFDFRLVQTAGHRDHVEPAFVAGGPLEVQVCVRYAAKFLLFAKSDRKLRPAEVVVQTCLDLDEDEGVAVHANQIDLSELYAPIANYGSISPRTQPFLGQVFPRPLDDLPFVGFSHDSVEGNLRV